MWTRSSKDNLFKSLVEQLPYAFTDPRNVIKSHISIVNTLIKIDVSIRQIKFLNEFKELMKCGRPIGSKDKNP